MLICGEGINGAATSSDGRTAGSPASAPSQETGRRPASVGQAGLAAAVRALDGRGPRTTLEVGVPEHFGLRRPESVTRAIYDGRLDERRLSELSPVVFAHATMATGRARNRRPARRRARRDGDRPHPPASARPRRGRSRARRWRVPDRGRSLLRATGSRDRGTLAHAARVSRLAAPPVLGAALYGLDQLGSPRRPRRPRASRVQAPARAGRLVRPRPAGRPASR